MEKCPRCHTEVDETLYQARLTGGGVTMEVCTACRKEMQQGSLESFAKDHVQAICDAANGGAKEIGKAFADEMNRVHRYLQGEFFMMLWHFFREYRKHEFDARNEWAVKLAGKWDDQVGK